MMNHTSKNQSKVNPGTVITGKWHGNQYVVMKELGSGANGIVYLAKFKGMYAALKMSDSGMSITSEVNVLKSFAKVQGSQSLGPSLLDVDDWQTRYGLTSFYAMEYIKGPDLLTFIQQKGRAWVPILFLQLLNDLAQLHSHGWIFGDLKPENLIVSGPPPKIRCIDVGGTTKQGRSIKEFTEFFDRGYWGLGSRKAEVTYDLFAVAMIMINTAYPKRFLKSEGGIVQLKQAIKKSPDLHPFENVIVNALQGRYQNANEMRQALLNCLSKSNSPKEKSAMRQSKQSNRMTKTNVSNQQSINRPHGKHQPLTRQRYRKNKRKRHLLEYVVISIVAGLFYSLYILIKLQ
ncbi:protein kinase domain-containing protein [Bacillus rubiinfantis]|uniref:protein kinase domain-containing protein n=1 Tax=Bacillus rubiinfantis TaxID=1499680 RepID=UPI0005A79212|nr:serine/threonine protein kinase [Bacillus rubiinfantis]